MRDFRLLWLARAVTAAGDWLLMIALPVHVLALTGSTLATSAVFLAELLPALLLGSVAGVLVDRWDRRRTLIAVNCAHAALLLPLLLLDRPGRLWLALAVAVLQSFLARLAGPAAFALLPTLVRAADLPRTNALLGLADAMARLGGAPLGGLVYAAGGLSGVVLIDASSFLAAAALAAAIRVGTAAGPATADPVHAAADAPVEESPLAEAVPRTGRPGWTVCGWSAATGRSAPSWPGTRSGSWPRGCSWCCSWCSWSARCTAAAPRSACCAGCRRSARPAAGRCSGWPRAGSGRPRSSGTAWS
jgi:MFS family permease